MTLAQIAITYEALLRHLASVEPSTTPPDLNDVARVIGKVASNLRRDLPRLRAEGLIGPEGLVITDAGRAALAAIDLPSGAWAKEGGAAGVRHDQLVPDPFNPRRDFDAEALEELADSIAEYGLIQAIAVRTVVDAEGRRRIVAGERRWRAIGILIARGDWGPDRPIPVRELDVHDETAAFAALVENMQRQDLNPIEEAHGFARLRDDYGLSTAEISAKLGKGRSQRHVQDRLQLLKLGADEQSFVASGDMSIEQARRELQVVEQSEKLVALKPDEKLLLGEILDKLTRHPKRKGDYDKATECAHDAKSNALGRLKNLHLVRVELDTYGNGRNYLREGYELYRARKASAAEPVPPDANGLYQSPFLNGPFELSPAMAETQAKKKAERSTERDKKKAAKVAAAERAAEFAQVVADPPRFAPSPQLDKLRELAARAKAPLPWSVSGDYDSVLDANGQAIGSFHAGNWQNEALDREGVKTVFALLAAAIAAPAMAAVEPEPVPAGAKTHAADDPFARQIREAGEGEEAA
jgi:ParB/RepB/Spo0J family partition protein